MNNKKLDKNDNIEIKAKIIIDGDISEKKFELLLNNNCEEDVLDYKKELDLSRNAEMKYKLELVKDISAMANSEGGYIVIGVEEDKTSTKKRFNPIGYNQNQRENFDESNIQQLLNNYIDEKIKFNVGTITSKKFRNKQFGMICIFPSDKSPIIFSKNGECKDSETKEIKILFKEGEIFVRRGTSTIRANQNDMRNIISKIRQREKENWTEDILHIKDLTNGLKTLLKLLSLGPDNISKIVEKIESGEIIIAPMEKEEVDDSSFFIDERSFEKVFLDVLLKQNDVLIRKWLNRTEELFKEKLEVLLKEDNDGILRIKDNFLIPILDKFISIGLIIAQYKKVEYFPDLIDNLYKIYKLPHRFELDNRPTVFCKFDIWQEIMKRVYALGAILLKTQNYSLLPILIRQKIDWDNYWANRFWAKHAFTMSARKRSLTTDSLCRISLDYIENKKYVLDQFENIQEAINLICQYDFIQCIHAKKENNYIDDCWPSFKVFYNERAEPIILNLIRNGESRKSVPQMDDKELARIIKELDEYLENKFFPYNGWCTNCWKKQEIKDFLQKHLQ